MPCCRLRRSSRDVVNQNNAIANVRYGWLFCASFDAGPISCALSSGRGVSGSSQIPPNIGPKSRSSILPSGLPLNQNALSPNSFNPNTRLSPSVISGHRSPNNPNHSFNLGWFLPCSRHAFSVSSTSLAAGMLRADSVKTVGKVHRPANDR